MRRCVDALRLWVSLNVPGVEYVWLGAIPDSGAALPSWHHPEVPPTRAVFVTAWAVTLAALLGVVLAGPEPFDQLGELPETALTLPSQVWVTVAVIYYALSTAILYRLARRSPATDTAFLVYVGLMAANEAWNYLLFAGDRLGWATAGMGAFAGYAVAVAVVLRRTPDPVVFRLFAPYVVWVLAYDVPWMLLTWNAGR